MVCVKFLLPLIPADSEERKGGGEVRWEKGEGRM